ncbi:hypothetical protein TELCIR_09117 [Teladorsagia circumcincta]|uniref:Uncharacterized protein n=1 Tax=Teladorsagia circumcincta TaxID=45464 RepID=A0A2G9UFQ9_TELCI|nr:hypothetical protein TELCIR_09117 [Teladorsagia circumcincta]
MQKQVLSGLGRVDLVVDCFKSEHRHDREICSYLSFTNQVPSGFRPEPPLDTPRGAPRGLVVPYMYTARQIRHVHTTEMKRLIAELDSRLQDCRMLASPRSSSPMSSYGSSKRATPYPPKL